MSSVKPWPRRVAGERLPTASSISIGSCAIAYRLFTIEALTCSHPAVIERDEISRASIAAILRSRDT